MPQEKLPERYTSDLESTKCALEKLSWMPGFDKVKANEKGFDLFAKVVARFVDDRGRPAPLDWLIEEISATCEFFPKPIQMRSIYEQKFPPLDGKTSAELISVLEDVA